MIPRELAKKIRYIQIYTSKAVNDVLAGEYESVFKGRGMEFDEVREYSPGDEIRSIDWNVTARMGHPYVKRFVEERELTIMFLVDLSASGAYGTVEKTKNEAAAEICALLAFSAIKNNDKVGLVLFTDTIEMFVPPKKGTSHVLRLIRDLLNFTPQHTKTDISIALDYLGRVMQKRCVAFLVSDFLCEPGFEKSLHVLGRRHDLIAVSISDPSEMALPAVGIVELEDAENGERLFIDTGNSGVRKAYQRFSRERMDRLRELFRSAGIDYVELFTGRDHVKDLVRFFRTREQRK